MRFSKNSGWWFARQCVSITLLYLFKNWFEKYWVLYGREKAHRQNRHGKRITVKNMAIYF